MAYLTQAVQSREHPGPSGRGQEGAAAGVPDGPASHDGG